MNEETEEKFNITNMIYQRYCRFINGEWKELEKLKRNSNTEISIVKKNRIISI